MARRLRTGQVPRSTVHAHPKNPRPVNDERVEAMMASYESDPSILERHPIVVVQNGNGLSVVSGHHRLMMANRLGLSDIWVDEWDMTEDEAYFELVRANEQEPLDLLAYGLHFIRMPQRMLPGNYAKSIGRSATFVAAARRAAEVYETLPGELRQLVPSEFNGWYLAHIGRTDPAIWGEVAQQVFTNHLSVSQTEALVNEYTTKTKRVNAPAPPGPSGDNPFVDDDEDGLASDEERSEFLKAAREAAEERERNGGEEEPMFKGGDTEAGRQPRKLGSESAGPDPREVFGTVLHLFRQAHDFVASINARDLDPEQKQVARQILQGMLDALNA